MAAYRARKEVDVRRRVFYALADKVESFRNVDRFAKLRYEIDQIKGPLLCHGMATLLQKLLPVRQCTAGEKGATRLGPLAHLRCASIVKCSIAKHRKLSRCQ